MTEFIVSGIHPTDNKEKSTTEPSRSEAEERKGKLKDLGFTDVSIEQATTDGGVEVVDHAGESTDTHDEPPEKPTTPDETALPDRDITDDPIAWLNREAGDFVDNIQGTDAINKKGFRVLQHFYEISTTSEVVVGPEETDFEYCRVKSVATLPNGQTAEAHGSAHTERGDDPELLLEMADTRAKSRALSDITGVGAVAVAEMKGSSEL